MLVILTSLQYDTKNKKSWEKLFRENKTRPLLKTPEKDFQSTQKQVEIHKHNTFYNCYFIVNETPSKLFNKFEYNLNYFFNFFIFNMASGDLYSFNTHLSCCNII